MENLRASIFFVVILGVLVSGGAGFTVSCPFLQVAVPTWYLCDVTLFQMRDCQDSIEEAVCDTADRDWGSLCLFCLHYRLSGEPRTLGIQRCGQCAARRQPLPFLGLVDSRWMRNTPKFGNITPLWNPSDKSWLDVYLLPANDAIRTAPTVGNEFSNPWISGKSLFNNPRLRSPNESIGNATIDPLLAVTEPSIYDETAVTTTAAGRAGVDEAESSTAEF